MKIVWNKHWPTKKKLHESEEENLQTMGPETTSQPLYRYSKSEEEFNG